MLLVTFIGPTEAFFSTPTPNTSFPKSKPMPDIVLTDENGKVVRIPVKNIERDWTWEDYTATGEFSCDLFVPENGQVKGCAFFMHGFSQYPVAYRKTLKEACEASNVAIVAVETGLLSSIVQEESKKVSFFKRKEAMQFFLQRAVSEDTKQCIRMVMGGSDVFAEYGVTKKAVGNKIAVMGHSMGGGLSFPVAADFSEIDYVFTMAPAFGVEDFDPIVKGVEERAPANSMLLAGTWDLIAPEKKINSISAAANNEKKNSSVVVDIERGLHTGFEDRLVLFNFKLSSVSNLLFLFGVIDAALFLIIKIFSFIRTNTGQLEGSGILMEYLLKAMVANKSIDPEEAQAYLNDNLEDRFEQEFSFKYGQD